MIARHGLPFIAGGDWNCSHMALQHSGWLSRTGAAILPFAAAAENHTCKAAGRDGGQGRILDFFVASSPLLGAMKAAHVDFAVP